jgi:prenyltransferase beta subunit
MIAALTRFRERFQWRQVEIAAAGAPGNDSGTSIGDVGGGGRTASGVTIMLLAALLFTFGGASTQKAEAAYAAQAGKAVTWLKGQQNSDGGFPSMPGGSSSVNITTRVMFALAATGINPLDVKSNATPYGYLVNNRKYITKASDIALTILAMKTVGQNPRDFKGRNLIEALRNRRGNGSFGNDVNVTAFSVLAFRSVGATKDAQYSIKWLYKAQNSNGGWGIAKGATSDSDSTGAALMAITGNKQANRAFGFLDGIQKSSGGFGNSGTANAQSTGLVMQGLVAQGRSVNYLRKNGNTAADYLLSLQQPDGSIFYAKNNDQTKVWVTADSTTALAGKTLPIGAPPREKNDNNSSDNNGGVTPGSSNPPDDNSTSTPTYTPSPGSLATPPDTSPDPVDTGNGGNGNIGAGNPGNGNSANDPTDDPTTTEPRADTSIPLVPVAPSSAVLAASEAGPQPSPLIATLIALVVTGGLCGGTILLARRFNW